MAAIFPYDLWFLVGCLIAIICYSTFQKYLRFKRAGVKINTPVPIFGNAFRSMFRRIHFVEELTNTYNDFPDEKYYGFLQFSNPFIVIRDPQLIKQITLREIESFMDHQNFFDGEMDPLFACNIFTLTGQKWRDMRATISPAFTGMKMKNMFHLMLESAEQLVAYLDQEIEKNNKIEGTNILEVDMKNVCSRMTNDMIASIAFGIKVDSLINPTNEFYTKSTDLITFKGKKLLKIFGYVLMPKIMKFFRLKVFSEEIDAYFRHLVIGTMKYREEQNIQRPDILQLLMEAKKGTLKHDSDAHTDNAGFATVSETKIHHTGSRRDWTDDQLAYQAIGFLFAGSETTSTLMCFVATELAINPDIQVKLQEEIDNSILENGNKFTYEIMQKMKYMDMIISETLRLWPSTFITNRICTKDYTFGPTTENGSNSYSIKRGDPIWVPIYAIQRDPKWWPNPEVFDPERFSDENKNNIEPFTYLPFGAGPRNCIGSRFALMEVKNFMYHFFANFNCSLGKCMEIPLKIQTGTFDFRPKSGFWLKVERRSHRHF